MKTVVLKNGAEEVESLVVVMMLSLERLIQTNPIAAYELVEVCKNHTHIPFGNTGDVLKYSGLMESNGQIHTSVKNVVLSAFEGDGLNMHLTSPVKQD